MRPGHDLDRLGDVGVRGDRPQLVAAGAHHVGQGVRVGLVALGSGHRYQLPVPGGLFRVDPVNLVAGRDQRPHPRPAIGLDTHQHLRWRRILRPQETGDQFGDQFVETGHARHTLSQPSRTQHPTVLVLHLNIVMIFCPVVTDEQHTYLHCTQKHHVRSLRKSPAA
jgi:hypothetical protein